MSENTPGLARRVLREPIIQFLLIGSALVSIGEFGFPDRDRYRIVVDERLRSELEASYQSQFGTLPDDRELRGLVNRHVEDEVLYREGLALSLDDDDVIVKRRIVQKMRFLVEDGARIAPPTDEAVEAWYVANTDRYTAPESVSFSHVYFRIDGNDEAAVRVRAEQALQGLRAGELARGPERGDPFPGPMEYGSVAVGALSRLFGASEFTERLPSAALDAWSGPYRSGYGWHLLYLNAHHASRRLPLAEVRRQAEQDLVEQERSARNEEALESLRRKYAVVGLDGAR